MNDAYFWVTKDFFTRAMKKMVRVISAAIF